MIKGQWTEIRVVIDLDQDEQSVYYDDQLLVTKSWTGGVAPGGALNIAAVDLWANDSSVIYYDDVCLEECGADINCDGTVGFSDLLILLASWGPCPGCPADLNNDDTVGFADLLILLAAWP